MSESNPTTDSIREAYARGSGGAYYSESVSKFDRWLDAHDAAVARRAVESLITGGVTFDPDRGGA